MAAASADGLKEAEAAIAELGYEFLDGSRLTKVGTKGTAGFEWAGEVAYNALGDAVERYIQRRMESEFGLVRTTVAGVSGEGHPVPVWASAGATDGEGTLLLLIQGSGAVRPGQWARSLCINATLDDGACLRALRCARERGWETLVLNPNHPSAGDPRAHARSVSDAIVAPSRARRVAVLAHSAGGMAAAELLRHGGRELCDRVAAVALTDAIHDVAPDDPAHVREVYAWRCVDWCSGLQGGGAGVTRAPDGVEIRPAGHPKHEWATAAAHDAVFEWLDDQLAAWD